MTLRAICTVAAWFLLATTLQAQDDRYRLGVGLSTLGPQIEGAYRITPQFAVRGVIAAIGADGQETVDGVTYDVSGQLGGFSVLGDYYTGDSGFRLTAGAFLSDTDLSGSATASPANPIEVGNTTLTAGETVGASVEFSNRISPVLAVGYDGRMGRNFTLSGEVGAVLMGGLDVQLDAPSSVSAADVELERRNIEDDLSGLDFYPYISISATFRF